MDHDSEDSVIEGGDGKKRPRREGDKSIERDDLGSLVARNIIVLGSNHFISATANG